MNLKLISTLGQAASVLRTALESGEVKAHLAGEVLSSSDALIQEAQKDSADALERRLGDSLKKVSDTLVASITGQKVKATDTKRILADAESVLEEAKVVHMQPQVPESMKFMDNRVKGLETEVEVVVSGFYSDNSPRIDLVDANTREPWATCTVMLPGESTLMENVVYIKDWLENEGMRALLVKNNVIEKLPNGVTNGVYMHRLMPEVVRMVNDARASLEAEAIKPDFNDFNQAHRYTVPVKTKLILSLPVTDFRPEAMRVTERMSANGTWFEVETFNATRNKWIDQKQHSTEAEAVADANGWYPQPTTEITPFDIGYFICCEESNLGLLKSFGGLRAGDYDHMRGGVMVEASESAMKMVADFPADFKVEGIVPESPEADAAPDGGDPSLKAQQENSPEI